MSDKKKNQKTTETARRIWLAGVGAYGRAFTEAQEALKEVTGKSSDVFDDLVQKGEMIEMGLNKKSKDFMEELNFDERIQKMRSRLRRGDDASDELEAAHERISSLEDKLDKILTLMEGDATPAPKKTAAAKKPAAKKPAVKKPAAKKPAAKKATTTRTATKRTPKK